MGADNVLGCEHSGRYFLDGLNIDFESALSAGAEAAWLTHVVTTLSQAAKAAIGSQFQLSVVRRGASGAGG